MNIQQIITLANRVRPCPPSVTLHAHCAGIKSAFRTETVFPSDLTVPGRPAAWAFPKEDPFDIPPSKTNAPWKRTYQRSKHSFQSTDPHGKSHGYRSGVLILSPNKSSNQLCTLIKIAWDRVAEDLMDSIAKVANNTTEVVGSLTTAYDLMEADVMRTINYPSATLGFAASSPPAACMLVWGEDVVTLTGSAKVVVVVVKLDGTSTVEFKMNGQEQTFKSEDVQRVIVAPREVSGLMQSETLPLSDFSLSEITVEAKIGKACKDDRIMVMNRPVYI